MVGPRWDRPRARRFEQCEPRTLLSGHPVAQVAAPKIADASFDIVESLRRLHEQYGVTGAGQTVVVIDTGIAYDHPALGGGIGAGKHVIGGWDFTDENDADPYDDAPAGFHGTHVAGIVGSIDPERTGVAPGADLIGLRVFDDDGRSDFEWIERALRWVHQNINEFPSPITTVNLSVGTEPQTLSPEAERILDDELAQLAADGIFVSVAAGNGYDVGPTQGLSYPASSPYVIPVGSVDADGKLSEFSRRDPRMLTAPGEDVVSTITDFLFDFNGATDDWHAFSGTSQAAPFVAGAAVLVREAMLEADGDATVDPIAIHRVLQDTADWAVDPESGINYARVNLPKAIDSLLSRKTSALKTSRLSSDARTAATDLGDIDFLQLERTEAFSGKSTYRLETRHDGWLTAEALFGSTVVGQLEIFDADGKRLGVGRGAGNRHRIDVDAKAKQTFYVRWQGETVGVPLRLANLGVNSTAELVTQITVPDAVDRVRVESEREIRVELQGLSYEFSATPNHEYQLRVNGDDRVHVDIKQPSAHAYVRPESVDILDARNVHLRILGGPRIDVTAVAGQGAQIRFYGSSRNERFVSQDRAVTFWGEDFEQRATGFDRVYVFGGGGEDRADLHGSAGNDVYVSHVDHARLTTADHLSFVESFSRVYAYADGGTDRAFFHGSAMDDSFAASPSMARLASGDQLSYTEFFGRVYAYAGQGGLDRAYLHGSDRVDVFRGAPDVSTLSGSDFVQSATAFDRVYAYSTPGDKDIAYLQGSAGDDWLTARDRETIFGGIGFHQGVHGFDQVYADGGSGGVDGARFVGNQENDRLDIDEKGVRMTTAQSRWTVEAFTWIEAVAGAGGFDFAVAPSLRAYDAATEEYVGEAYRLRSRDFNWLFRDALP